MPADVGDNEQLDQQTELAVRQLQIPHSRFKGSNDDFPQITSKVRARLQVGTLDQLVGLSDDLGKLDGFVEQVTRKVASYLGEVLEDQRDKLQENLTANNSMDLFRRS